MRWEQRSRTQHCTAENERILNDIFGISQVSPMTATVSTIYTIPLSTGESEDWERAHNRLNEMKQILGKYESEFEGAFYVIHTDELIGDSPDLQLLVSNPDMFREALKTLKKDPDIGRIISPLLGNPRSGP